MIQGFAAEYFRLPGGISRLSQIDFPTAPDAIGVVSELDFATGRERFWEGGADDNFAARYTGYVRVETAGTYTFHLTSDDGSALWLDGAQVIDNDGLHGARTRTVTLDLDAGMHALDLAYFERTGLQTLQLEWQGPDTGNVLRVLNGASVVHDAVRTPGLAAEYFVLSTGVQRLAEIDFDAAPDAVGVVSEVNFATGSDSFWEGGAEDNFAARYTGHLQVETAGTYTLFLTSDDGSMLSIDGIVVIDNDGMHKATTRTVTLDLDAGTHALDLAYFEASGGQVLQLEWAGPDTGGARQVIDGTALTHAAPETEPEAQPETGPETGPETAPDGTVDDSPASDAPAGKASARLEAGSVRVAQDNPDRWHAVTFAETILDARVVMGPISGNGSNPAVVRVRNVTDTGFEFQIDEWEYLDGFHVEETIGWLAGTAGSHTLGTGQTVAFGRTALSDDTAVPVTLEGFSTRPAAFAQITSANDASAVTHRLDAVTSGGFSVRMQEEEAADQMHAAETLDWVAIDAAPGGTLAVGQATVDHAFARIAFDGPAGTPVLLADQQTENGSDTAALRLHDLDASGGALVVEEERSRDNETGHVQEQVAYLAIADGTAIDLGPLPAPAAPALALALAIDGPEGSGTWDDADGSGDVTPGDTLAYTYTLVNEGDVALTDVTLSDAAAPGLSAADLVGLTDADGDGAADDLAVGATATATRPYTVTESDAGMVLTSVATASSVNIGAQEAVVETTVEAQPEPIKEGPGVVHLKAGDVATIDGGRVAQLVVPESDVSDLRLVEQPEHGHASVNPDSTITLVMTRSDHVGALDLRYEVTHTDGMVSQYEAKLDVVPGLQEAGWGTSENHYMLATDAGGQIMIEHGDNHRKVYVSEDGLTAADIAILEGVDPSTVTANWLKSTRPDYGASEDAALAPDIGFGLWYEINPRGSENSNWLLMERGGTYDPGRLFPRDASGESALHPMFVGSWGEGDAPEVVSRAEMFQGSVKNIVTQGINFSDGIRALDAHENIIFNNSIFSGTESVFQGFNGAHTGITFRNSSFLDAWQEMPGKLTQDNEWDPFSNRESGLYASGIDGLLFEGIFFDHNGWASDFDPDGDVIGGHPPSMFSHNLYVQSNTADVTMRDSITMRGASVGAQLRNGAFVEDNVFLNNNVAFNVNGGSEQNGPDGNYSLLLGNLVTSAAARGADAPLIGALDWGIRNEALLTTLIDNIVTHANDPDDPGDTVEGSSANARGKGEDSVFTDDTIVWRWGAMDVNAEGLDPAALNATTIQRYVADLLGTDVATIDDLAQYLRSLDGTEYAAATADILNYFRSGFGIEDVGRTEPDTLRFIPDVNGDGVRWDNRLNWDSGDLPGTVAGDSVDLGGNVVVFGGTVTLEDMAFGLDGGLIVNHGRLDVTGSLTSDAGATLDVDNAGQFWTNGASGTDMLDITVTGGRFANTGLFESPATLTASGGQTILASGGAEFHVESTSRIDISGSDTRIGFDGDGAGTAILRFAAGATLGFTASDGEVSVLGEFRSGAFGAAPAVQSGIDLGDAILNLDVSAIIGTKSLTLAAVDELIGTFSELRVAGLGNRDATVSIDYVSDMIRLDLSAGTGQTRLAQAGDEDMVDTEYAALWEQLSLNATAIQDPFDL